MDFKQEIITILAKETKLSRDEIENRLSIPPDSKLGDYAFPCFKLSGNPKGVAEKLKQKIKLPKFISKIETVGPYLNFYLNPTFLSEKTLVAISTEKDKYGRAKKVRETVIVEFFHANTHKGVHIGHLRNISLGAAVANLLEATGRKVIRVNYQGDIGPHVAKCLWGYLNFKEKEPLEKKGIWLGKIYARASQAIEGKENLQEEVKLLNDKIYAHDKSIELLWKKTRKWCLDDFNAFYKEFGVKYDRLYFESEVDSVGKQVFQSLLNKGIAAESQGAMVVDLSQYGLDLYVGITSQGNPTYYGKELGLAELKLREFKFDKSLHIVGSEQNLFFKQIFKTYELMKSPLANCSEHISYGLVMLPEGKMSSRAGTMVLYDNLYSEMMKLSRDEIKKRHTTLSETEIEKRAKMITFGALKYAMIARENQRSLVFDWEQVLDFEGDTGPYLQYAYARCSSIFRKAGQKIDTKVRYELLNTDHEQKVILHLSKFSGMVSISAEQHKPYLLAKYLLDLAQYFSEFYHNCPVISEQTELMHARLLLVSCVRQVLKNGLRLLGIDAPERM